MPILAKIQRVIASVPRGKVITYGKAAALAGYPGGARLTVRALRSTEGLPWHRVVASGGRIALVGEDGREQRLRLEMEQVTFRGGCVRMELHEWTPRPRAKSNPRRSKSPIGRSILRARPNRSEVTDFADPGAAHRPEVGPRDGSDEWLEWHRGYGKGGLLARRLRVVQKRIREALDRQPPGKVRILSLCSGDGRDLIGVLADHPRAADVRARLIEQNRDLASIGREQVQDHHLSGVSFRVGDASTTDASDGAVPADIVLVCGVFGNITDSDVRNTIDHLRELCASRATVIWTRGRFQPDLTPTLRDWFRSAGFTERSFDTIPGTTASVGVHLLTERPRPFRPGVRLFTFLPKNERPSARPGRVRDRRSSARQPRGGVPWAPGKRPE